MNKKIEAIDLFCGVGGLTFGLQQANIEVKIGIDNDASCAFAYEKNNSGKFILANVEKLDFSIIASQFSANTIKLLVGCAPCQPFSTHSHKKKDKTNDKRWNLLGHFSRAINEINPDIVSMENVAGLTKTAIFIDFVNDLKKSGYNNWVGI